MSLLLKRFASVRHALKMSSFYWRVGYYGLLFAGIVHVAFIILFWWIDVPVLIWVNVLSVAMYAYAILGLGLYTLQTKDDRLIGWLVYIELLGHNLLASYLLSKEAGFQYYIYALVILPFFVTTYKREVYIVRMIGAVAAALAIDISPWFAAPKVAIDEQTLSWLHHLNVAIFLGVLGLLAYLYAFYEAMYRAVLLEERTKDPMTRLYNRRYVDEILPALEEKRYGVLLVDIDWFKKINDTYGHLCGDRVIIETAKRLKEITVGEGVAVRWGGEEFLVLIPHADESALRRIAERIRIALREVFVCWQEETVKITVTVGAALRRQEEAFEVTLIRADEALYLGKSNGRDQVHIKE